jgi:hypothetical protein
LSNNRNLTLETLRSRITLLSNCTELLPNSTKLLPDNGNIASEPLDGCLLSSNHRKEGCLVACGLWQRSQHQPQRVRQGSGRLPLIWIE